MVRPLHVAAAGALGYGLGSIPFGVLVGRLQGGVDVREHGSRSMGTTNVLRTVGGRAGASTFCLDVSKGAVAVAAVRAAGGGDAVAVAGGLGAVVGHSWPCLAGFRGGKSIATAFGTILVLAPRAAACAVVGGLSALAATRVVSVGSLAATTSAAAESVMELRRGRWAPAVFVVPAAAVIFYRHLPNLQRIRRGTEPTLDSLRLTGLKRSLSTSSLRSR